MKETSNKAYVMDGEYIYFGSYPQRKVTNKTLLEALGGYDANTWKCFDNYYFGGKQQALMHYCDKEYNGSRYRGVYFTQYRPSYANRPGTEENSFQDENGYRISTVYWFRYAPIKWKIVESNDECATLVSQEILDSQEFISNEAVDTATLADYQGNSATTHLNNYRYSSIRSWLNTTFYNTAFDEFQKELIQTITVDNSPSSMGYDYAFYNYADTNDKLWLLSHHEVNTYFGSNEAKVKKGTNYAKCQGLFISPFTDGTSYWWLRSPHYFNYHFDAKTISDDGDVWNSNVGNTSNGVVPALKLLLK